MALANLGGYSSVPIGIGANVEHAVPGTNVTTLDAANEALIFVGHIITSDGGSHTINTTGSSSLGWKTGTCTWADGSSIVKVGLAAVSTTTGPPARPANVSNVITFDVSKSLIGGSGITSSGWQTHVPDNGSKTIANGDLVAFAVQMTARGGTDSVQASYQTAAGSHWHRPVVTQYVGGTYTAATGTGVPCLMITFADGALGFMADSDVAAINDAKSFNNAGATKEYGQLFQLPFPVKLCGIYAWVNAAGSDFDFVLYSNPLVTPIAERTVSIDGNTVASATGRRIAVYFPSPYSTTANQLIVVACKPGSGIIAQYFKTLNNATHRIADAWGTTGYGVSRGTGAFSDLNSSLDHFYMGLLAGAFDGGGGAGGGSFSGFIG